MTQALYDKCLASAARFARNLMDAEDMLHNVIEFILKSAEKTISLFRVIFLLKNFEKKNFYIKPYLYQSEKIIKSALLVPIDSDMLSSWIVDTNIVNPSNGQILSYNK